MIWSAIKTVAASLLLATLVMAGTVLAVDAIEFQQTWRCDECVLLPLLRPDLEVLK